MVARVILKAVLGEEAGHQFVYADHSQLLIGRSDRCSLCLPADDTVSRRHCLLDIERSGVHVQDLGSKNGTFVNGVFLGSRASDDENTTQTGGVALTLHSGDALRVGHNLFVIEICEAGDSAQLEAGKLALA